MKIMDTIKEESTTVIYLEENSELRNQYSFNYSSTPLPDEGSPKWILLALVVVPLWVVSGNILVLLAVMLHRTLQNLSNRVIASLAFTDLLLGLLVVPIGIYKLIIGRWNFGFYVCLIWTGSDVILSTASIMHLCAIAVYRYRGIARPLQVRGTSQGRHVVALVASSWSISLALSIPLIVQGILDPSNVLVKKNISQLSNFTEIVNYNHNETKNSLHNEQDVVYDCGIFDQTFTVYSSLVSFFIPLAIMIFADIRSIKILRRHVKNPSLSVSKSKSGMSPNTNTSTRKNPEQPNRSTGFNRFPQEQNVSNTNTLCAREQSIYSIGGVPESNSMTSQLTANSSARLFNSRGADGARSSVILSPIEIESSYMDEDSGIPSPSTISFDAQSETCRSCLSVRQTDWTAERPGNFRRRQYRVQRNTERQPHARRSRSKSMIYFNMLASRGKERVNGRERRAEKTLIWVFATFVILWLPFFSANLAYGICGAKCSLTDQLFTAFTWLGYLSSGVNPCIYTFLNRDFRRAFKNILLCRRESLKERRNKTVIPGVLYSNQSKRS